MDVNQVAAQLNDLPATYRRLGAPYTQLVDSQVTALTDFTAPCHDVLTAVADFNSAQWGWLDVWGLLLGVARNKDEGDPTYSARITGTILAWVGTVPAIEAWGTLILGQQVIVTENFPAFGYTVTLPDGVSLTQMADFAVTFAHARPAGVPFTFNQIVSGLYLDTIDFFNVWQVVGEYLDDGTAVLAVLIGGSTVNAKPLLPDAYLTDPTLNP